MGDNGWVPGPFKNSWFKWEKPIPLYDMNDLIENLQRFLDAGDESRHYQLTRDEVRMLLDKLCKCVEVPVLSFDDIKRESKKKSDALLESFRLAYDKAAADFFNKGLPDTD